MSDALSSAMTFFQRFTKSISVLVMNVTIKVIISHGRMIFVILVRFYGIKAGKWII